MQSNEPHEHYGETQGWSEMESPSSKTERDSNEKWASGNVHDLSGRLAEDKEADRDRLNLAQQNERAWLQDEHSLAEEQTRTLDEQPEG